MSDIPDKLQGKIEEVKAAYGEAELAQILEGLMRQKHMESITPI